MKVQQIMRIQFNVAESERLMNAMDTILLSRNIIELPQDVYVVCQGLLDCSKDFLSNLRNDLL